MIFNELLLSLSFGFHVYKIGIMILLPMGFVDRRYSVPVYGVTEGGCRLLSKLASQCVPIQGSKVVGIFKNFSSGINNSRTSCLERILGDNFVHPL